MAGAGGAGVLRTKGGAGAPPAPRPRKLLGEQSTSRESGPGAAAGRRDACPTSQIGCPILHAQLFALSGPRRPSWRGAKSRAPALSLMLPIVAGVETE